MRGRDQEFAEFFSARFEGARRIAYAMCGSWPDAEEIAQSAFGGQAALTGSHASYAPTWQHRGVMPQQVPTVTIPDLPESLPEGVTLLDVREPDEWAAGHAPEAVHIPMGELTGRLDDLPADNEVYVVCRSGGRSARVTQFLNANGWDAKNVDGGMQQWQVAGRPMSADNGTPTVI